MDINEVYKRFDIQSIVYIRVIPMHSDFNDAINNVEGLVKDFRATKIIKVKGKKGQEDAEIEVPVLGSDDRKLAYDATKKVLEAPGLLSGGAVSVQIGKLTVNTQTNIISPNVLDLLKRMSTTVPIPCDTEALECEVVESSDDNR